jgi:choline kinase
MADSTILVLPIGGQATRIGGIPKFMLPVSDQETLISRHVRAAQVAGIERIYIICRPMHSELIKNYFNDTQGNIFIIELAQETSTMNETLANGMREISFDSAIIGLPDTYWTEEGLIKAYSKLYEQGISSEISLAVFRIREDQIGKLGQVKFNSDYELIDISDKNPTCKHEYAWGALKIQESIIRKLDSNLPHVGYTVRKEFESGVKIHCVEVKCKYFDCGTFKEYSNLIGSISG